MHVAKQPRLVMSEYTYDSGVVAKQPRPVKCEDPCDSGVVAKRPRLVKSEDPYDSGVVAKRPRLVKSEDDSTPLPDPFPLPKHYHHNVDSALRSKKMSTKDKQQFISEVASAMLQYKKYPSRDDYVCVARSIVAKYPFLKSSDAKPYVSYGQHAFTMNLCVVFSLTHLLMAIIYHSTFNCMLCENSLGCVLIRVYSLTACLVLHIWVIMWVMVIYYILCV